MKMNKKYITLFTAIILTVCSCKNSFQNTLDIIPEEQDKDVGIITVSANANNIRSISPSADDLSVANLTNIKLEGLWGDETTPRTVISEKATWSAFQAVSTTAVQTGSWVFTLTAQLNGMNFSATQGTSTNPVTITKNTTTNLTFELESSGNYGGLSIVINVTQGDASKVVATLKTRAGVQVDTQTLTMTSTGSGKTATYSVSITDSDSDGVPDGGIEAGNYNLDLEFDGVNLSSGALLPLNNWKGIVRINAGITTTSTINWTTGDVYTLVFERNDGLFPGDVIPNTFTRKTTITLPEMTKTGYLFEGWYTDAAFSADKKIAEVSSSTMTPDEQKEMTVYARYIDTLYVDEDGASYTPGTYEDGTRLDSAFFDINGAISKIINTGKDTHNVDWKIMVNGYIQTQHTISNSLTSSYANSITIQGYNTNTSSYTDILDGCDEGTSLTINTAVPVTIQNIKITGGGGTRGSTINSSLDTSYYGGGLIIQQGSVTLSNGALITENACAHGGAIFINDGATLKLEGSAYIPAGVDDENDIYFRENTTPVTILGQLTPPAACTDNIIAKFTLDSSITDKEDMPMIIEPGSDGFVESCFANFGITSTSTADAYFINPDGKTVHGYLINKDNYATVVPGISAAATDVITLMFVGDPGTALGEYALNQKIKDNTNCCLIDLDLSYTSGLTAIANQAFYSNTKLHSVLLPDTVTAIGNSAFRSNTNLVSINLPSNITSLGTWTFDSDSSLTSIQIPKKLTTLSMYVFRKCTSLSSVTFEEGTECTSIGTNDSADEGPFNECTALQSITIPDSVETIGMWAFWDCSSLTSVSFGSNSQLRSIGSQAFKGCNLLSLTLPDNGNDITVKDSAFDTNQNLANVNLGSAKTLGTYAFRDCKKITTINLSNITEVGNGAFTGCICLSDVTLGPCSIGDYAFRGCPLTALSLTGITSIGREAFYQTETTGVSITSLTIPSSVLSIGMQAFYNWPLSSVTFESPCWSVLNSQGTSVRQKINLDGQTPSQMASAFMTSGSTYNSSYPWKQLRGTKTEPTATGDIVFNDGSAIPYTNGMTLTDYQKAGVVAYIFDDSKNLSNDGNTTRLLGVGIAHHDTGFEWLLESSSVYSQPIADNLCTYSGSAGNYTFTDDVDGSDNFDKFVNAGGDEDDSPVFTFAQEYWDEPQAQVQGSSYQDLWYIPSIAELYYVWQKRDIINDILSLVFGNDDYNLSANYYWSSSTLDGVDYAYIMKWSDSTISFEERKSTLGGAIAIRQFN